MRKQVDYSNKNFGCATPGWLKVRGNARCFYKSWLSQEIGPYGPRIWFPLVNGRLSRITCLILDIHVYDIGFISCRSGHIPWKTPNA